jgi:hypothetical protein
MTVTRVTRTQKTEPEGASVTHLKVEVHTATANFVLECESIIFPSPNADVLNCADLEPGTYEARMLSPAVVSLWPKEAVNEGKQKLVLYTVTLEEARAKLQGPKTDH